MLETFIDRYDKKIIIDIEELKDSERLEGAFVFNKIFNLKDSLFKKKDFPRNDNNEVILLKLYDISIAEWLSFMKFIRYGTTKYDIVLFNTNNNQILDNYSKLFFENLDKITETGVFIKFGPFPVFDNYIKNRKNQLKKLNLIFYNPMTPQEDNRKLYDWSINFKTPSSKESENNNNKIWSATVSSNTGIPYWRKLK